MQNVTVEAFDFSEDTVSNAVGSIEAAPKLRLKAPNKRSHEVALEEINTAISQKETQVRNIQSVNESIQEQLRDVRDKKYQHFNKKKQLIDCLKEIKITLSKGMDDLTRIQGTLSCKNEDRINQNIARLSHQLKSNNYLLREERKIVAEIDQLNRSKKTLKHFQSQQQKVNEVRDHQRRIREEKDTVQNEITEMLQREGSLKTKLTSNKAKQEELHSDISNLRDKRRQQISEYTTALREFNDYQKKKKEELHRQKEEERRLAQEQYEKKLAEYESQREPYEEERALCATLIEYLQAFLANIDPTSSVVVSDGTSKAVSASSSASASAATPPASLEAEPGMYMLRRKTDNDGDLYSGTGTNKNKGNRRAKRDRRAKSTNTNKAIKHGSAAVFKQFSRLHVKPPMTLGDVPDAIQQLKEKKAFWEDSLSLHIPVSSHALGANSSTNAAGSGSSRATLQQKGCESATPSECLSQAESALADSIVSTPEISVAGSCNTPPAFPCLPVQNVSATTTAALGGTVASQPQLPPTAHTSLSSSTLVDNIHHTSSAHNPHQGTSAEGSPDPLQINTATGANSSTPSLPADVSGSVRGATAIDEDSGMSETEGHSSGEFNTDIVKQLLSSTDHRHRDMTTMARQHVTDDLTALTLADTINATEGNTKMSPLMTQSMTSVEGTAVGGGNSTSSPRSHAPPHTPATFSSPPDLSSPRVKHVNMDLELSAEHKLLS